MMLPISGPRAEITKLVERYLFALGEWMTIATAKHCLAPWQWFKQDVGLPPCFVELAYRYVDLAFPKGAG